MRVSRCNLSGTPPVPPRLIVLTLAVAWGCEPASPPAEQAPSDAAAAISDSVAAPTAVADAAPPPPPLDPSAFAERAVGAMWRLGRGGVPSQWIASHVGDEVEYFRHDPVGAWRAWCVRVVRRDTVSDGRAFERHAYFYPPPPPTDLAIPALADSARLPLDECELGAIWMEIREPDREEALRLASALADGMTNVYGPGVSYRARFFGAYDWQGTRRWASGQETMVSAYDAEPLDGGSGRVILYGVRGAASVRDLPSWSVSRAERIPDWRKTLLSSAERTARLDSQIIATIDSLVAGAEPRGRTRRRTDPRFRDTGPLVATITRLVADADPSDPAAHAARLVVADILHSLIVKWIGLKDFPEFVVLQSPDADTVALRRVRDSLAVLGAHYERWGEPAAEFVYKRDWLITAVRVDPGGAGGGLAALLLGDRSCNGAEVIAIGESQLEQGTDDALRPLWHYLVAEAYRDIVTVSTGGLGEYTVPDPARYHAQVPAARLGAVRHYREAIARGLDTGRARAAWLEAWRLVAGLPPMRYRFVCIYD